MKENTADTLPYGVMESQPGIRVGCRRMSEMLLS